VPARAWVTWPSSLCAVGGLALVVGLVLAYVARDLPSPVAAVVVLAVGNVLVLVGTAATVRRERAPRGLILPAGLHRLPAPAWWFPVGATGLVDLAAGPAVAGWLGLAGVVLVAAAAGGAGRSLLRPDTGPDRAVVRAARRLRTVARPGYARLIGALEPIGRSGVRVVSVGPAGWIDVVLGPADRARAAAALGGLELLDQSDPAFSRAFGALRNDHVN
jgi:hypothetical protein